MSTGYFAEGTTTNRTKVHFVEMDEDEHHIIPACRTPLGAKREYLFCAHGWNPRVVECKKCLKLVHPLRLK